jgi:hypothetical protein
MSDFGEKRKDQVLREQMGSFLLLATFCLAAAAVGSFLTTYLGTKQIVGWLAGVQEQTRLMALMVSFLATTLNFVLFGGIIRLLPLFMTGGAKMIGMLVLSALLCLNVSALTSTSVIGMTGTSARAQFLQAEARSQGLLVHTLSERALAQREFVDFIGPDAEASCESAAEELRTGGLSGSRGAGPVYSSMQTLCTRKTAIAEALAINIATSGPLIDGITQLSRSLDAIIIDRSLSIEERELQFLRAVRQLESGLLDLRAADRMNAIRASYRAMQDAISGLEDLVDGYSAGQAAAIRTLIAREEASARAVEEYIARIERTPLPPLYRTELLPLPRVVVRYAIEHWPQVALAALVDGFAPLVAVLAFAAALRRREQLKTPKEH